MSAEHVQLQSASDDIEFYNWQQTNTTSDTAPSLEQHYNLSHDELLKLQLDIIRNFTRLYGSAAIARGQLQGDVLRHQL